MTPSRLSAGGRPELRPAGDSSTCESARRCLAGVDEAGLGPILGPLVVAGVVMHGAAGLDPWAALACVSRERHEPGRIRVADSKKVKQGPRGLERLELTALAFVAAVHGRLPDDVPGLLALLGVDLAPFGRCPWYTDLARALPRFGPRAAIDSAAATLTAALATAAITIDPPRARSLDAAEFNARIDATDNKSDAHFEVYGALLAELLRDAPDGAHVVCDRCGGRQRYRSRLGALLPDAHVRTLGEAPEQSRYALRVGARRLAVTFAADAEDRAFPTALASCIAKYVRELAMECMNAWFAARIDGLRPTAGYYVDGLRFLADVDALLCRDGLPRDRLVRAR